MTSCQPVHLFRGVRFLNTLRVEDSQREMLGVIVNAMRDLCFARVGLFIHHHLRDRLNATSRPTIVSVVAEVFRKRKFDRLQCSGAE